MLAYIHFTQTYYFLALKIPSTIGIKWCWGCFPRSNPFQAVRIKYLSLTGTQHHVDSNKEFCMNKLGINADWTHPSSASWCKDSTFQVNCHDEWQFTGTWNANSCLSLYLKYFPVSVVFYVTLLVQEQRHKKLAYQQNRFLCQAIISTMGIHQGSHRNSKTQVHDFSMINNAISMTIQSTASNLPF